MTLLQLSKGTTSTELSKATCAKFPKSVSSEGFLSHAQPGLSADSVALALPRGASTEALTDVPPAKMPKEAIKGMSLENSKGFGKEEMLFKKVSEAPKRPARPSPTLEDPGSTQREHLAAVGMEAAAQLSEVHIVEHRRSLCVSIKCLAVTYKHLHVD